MRCHRCWRPALRRRCPRTPVLYQIPSHIHSRAPRKKAPHPRRTRILPIPKIIIRLRPLPHLQPLPRHRHLRPQPHRGSAHSGVQHLLLRSGRTFTTGTVQQQGQQGQLHYTEDSPDTALSWTAMETASRARGNSLQPLVPPPAAAASIGPCCCRQDVVTFPVTVRKPRLTDDIDLLGEAIAVLRWSLSNM